MKLVRVLPPLLIGVAFFCLFRPAVGAGPAPFTVLLGSSGPASLYDPAAIRYSRDYFFLENLFSPLVEYSAADELVSGLAERFEWTGREARFTMRAGVKTADGRAIDAYDAELSLKRLFILGGGQEFLKPLLCGDKQLASLADQCPGLAVAGDGRVLVMKLPEKKPFVFHLLANISYAVIPGGSLDAKTLRITDYRNTSGPYYVARDSVDGGLELAANPGHYRYSPAMPQSVKIIPLDGELENEQILSRFREKSADYLPAGLVRSPGDKADFVSANPGYSLRLSRPMRMIYAVFTDSGMKRLSGPERFFIAGKLRGLFGARHAMAELPGQIFSMEGGLSREQLEDIRGRFSAPGGPVLRKTVRARRLYGYFSQDEAAIKEWLPGVVYSDLEPQGGGRAPAPDDLYLLGCDVGFQDDIGLVSYYLGMDFFDMTADGKKKWFSAYLAAPDKKNRIKMLQALHYETLAGGRALPLALLPYASVARKPWTFVFPGLLAGDHLWRLRKE